MRGNGPNARNFENTGLVLYNPNAHNFHTLDSLTYISAPKAEALETAPAEALETAKVDAGCK